MNYQDTVDWMFHQLPMYQNQGASAYKEDLSNTLKLAEHLHFPERRFKSIHVAGTNGKGSTSHMIASILQEEGYRVGLYTSPHLKDFRERIKINGACIDQAYVVEFIDAHRSFLESNGLSFFEMTVGMAFDYFSKQQVDIAVIEVGLGGRLDSTNIINPEVSVITNIGMDHMRFLGNSLESIAKEKGGIIKPGVPVVIGETQNETKRVFDRLARDMHAPIYFADQLVAITYKSDLKGIYQQRNIRTAILTIWELRKKGFNFAEESIRTGLLNVMKNTDLLGRWQVLQQRPKVICDVAHNREGLALVMDQLRSESLKNLHVVIGMVSDKDISQIVDLFPEEAQYYFCRPNVLRGLDAEILKTFFIEKDRRGQAYPSVKLAFESALENADDRDLIYVGGSTFVVAEII
jgi:dihydrofolate synthase/folylpolyglutamate synthase